MKLKSDIIKFDQNMSVKEPGWGSRVE